MATAISVSRQNETGSRARTILVLVLYFQGLYCLPWISFYSGIHLKTYVLHSEFNPLLIYQLNEWNQVGATYDNTTGVAQLWHNGKMVKSRNIGQIKLATQYPIRIGARDGDDRRFAGKIACLQIYNKALDEQQIGNLKSCPVKGNAVNY